VLPPDTMLVATVVQTASLNEFFLCTVKLCGNNNDCGGVEFHPSVIAFEAAL
jgi:hypothetical protein